MLHTFSQLSADSAIGTTVRDSIWMFPAVEGVHLLALALLGGAVLVVDISLLGFGLRAHQAREIEKTLRPWMIAGLVGMVVSGALMWASQALGYYVNLPFRLKMAALVAAVIFSFGIKPRLLQSATLKRGGLRATACVSLTLWAAVGIAGRGIGFW